MSANYTFEELLSPYDFEVMVKDLLSRDLGIELVSFAEGPDGGVDLRCSTNPENKIIVQCKRTKNLSLALLLSEGLKLSNLEVDKYYLALSKDITPAKANQILEIFSNWMTDDSFIYSKGRLNQLLEKFPDILRRNYKLWVNSSEIFDQFINNDLLGRSNFLIDDIANSLKYYVRNDSYDDALNILNSSHFIIISGIPGIGKSTLARILVWEYLQAGFELVEIRNIHEGERVLREDREKKQIFFFDDFLGENFLQYDVIKGRANDLFMFFKRFSANENKYLIMTTREYILKQAREKYSKLNREELDLAKYTLDLNNYSEDNKALILYNHLFYSTIGKEYIKKIINNKTYEKIISHKNYSPRIIEAMTVQLKSTPIDKYASEFIANLDRPFRVWETAFEKEISTYSQVVLYVLNSMGRQVYLNDLEQAFLANLQAYNLPYEQNSFRDSIQEVEGTFIKINVSSDDLYIVEFLNPSIKDFLSDYMARHKKVLQYVLESSIFWNQLIHTFVYIAKKNQKYMHLVKNKIMNVWTSLDSCHLEPNYFKENSWRRRYISDLEKLRDVVNISELDEQKDLIGFSLGEFEGLSLEESTDYWDFYYYLEIVKTLSKHVKLNGYRIIEDYTKNMLFHDHLFSLPTFEELFPDDYDEFIVSEKELIKQRILDILNEDIENADNVDTLREIIIGIEDFEKKFEVDLNWEHEKAQEKIERLIEEKADKPAHRKNTESFKKNAKINLEKLFSTEMFGLEE